MLEREGWIASLWQKKEEKKGAFFFFEVLPQDIFLDIKEGNVD